MEILMNTIKLSSFELLIGFPIPIILASDVKPAEKIECEKEHSISPLCTAFHIRGCRFGNGLSFSITGWTD